MNIFKAGTQSGDWDGSAAADCYQGASELDAYLTKKGLMKPNELCIAMSFSVGENQVGMENDSLL